MSLHLENEGFSPLVGKIYTLLLFSSEPLSLQQMAEALSVSKAAISVQIRTMELRHLCHKVPVQNDRKDYYYITDDFGINVVCAYTGKMKSVQQAVEGALAGFPEKSKVEPEDEEAYFLIIQRFKEISMLCEMFISRMRDLNEEWQLKRQML
jgi:DNA-binding transcriptional regulator GbsR (MarR family)